MSTWNGDETDEIEVPEATGTLAGQPWQMTVITGGERLDHFLVAALPALTRSALQRLIETGAVTLNGAVTRPAQKVRVGDVVTVHIPSPRPATLEAQPLPLAILYEDADLLVIDKAAGMPVHPGAGNPSGTLVNAVLARCPDLQGVGGEVRPGIVHRLDKDTSGVIVVAKNDAAHQGLQRQFKTRAVHKTYVALLIGALRPDEGLIDAPIGRHPVHRQKMAVVAAGREARTRWHVLAHLQDATGRPYTLVEAYPETGRTHQIRVHFAWLGYPLVGDVTYGPAQPPLPAPRQFLHARELTLHHPITGQVLTFHAPLPEDLSAVLATLTPA